MATQRLHKVIFGPAAEGTTRNHFALVIQPGTSTPLADPSATAQAKSAAWPNYGFICVETNELYPHVGPSGDHNRWVLRGRVRCCCAPACGYPSDHASGHYGHLPVATSMTPVHTAHGPAQDYVEASLALAELQSLAHQGQQAASDSTTRSSVAAELTATASQFDIEATEIDAHLGVVGTDANGLLSAEGASATVLAGTSTVANDYYAVAALLLLYQRLVYAAYTKITADWPQRGQAKPITLGPRVTH